jgi:hypothetical protein
MGASESDYIMTKANCLFFLLRGIASQVWIRLIQLAAQWAAKLGLYFRGDQIIDVKKALSDLILDDLLVGVKEVERTARPSKDLLKRPRFLLKNERDVSSTLQGRIPT